MGDDALASSLSEHAASLERRIRELEALAPQRQRQIELLQQQIDVLLRFRRDIGDILDGLDLRLDRATTGILSDREYIKRLEQAVQDVARVAAIQQAAAPDALAPADYDAFERAVADAKALHKPKRSREGCHLRLVQGSALGAVALALVKWPWPKKTALAALLALVTAGPAVMPGIGAQPVPAQTLPRAHAAHHRAQPHVRPSVPAPAVTLPDRRRCRDRDGDADVRAVLTADRREVCRDGPRDEAAPVPARSPAPRPSASPSPSLTPTPAPSVTPSPSCTAAPPSTVPQVPASSPPVTAG